MKKILTLLAILTMISATSGLSGESAWTPDRATEVVVGSAAGGGADLHGRTMAEIALQYGWITTPMIFNYQTGATGNIAFGYTLNKEDDPHTIMNAVGSYDVAAIINDSPIKIQNMGVLAVTVLDEYLVCVSKDSPYKTFDDLIEGMRSNPGTITWSGGLTGALEDVVFKLLCQQTGVSGSYVGFDGQSDAIVALLGGHISVGIFVPSASAGHIESGDFIPLTVFSTKRLGGLFSEVKTARELGYDIVMSLPRGFLCSPKMPANAQAFYRDMISKVTETPEWHKYTAKNQITERTMIGEEAKQFLYDNAARITAVLEAAGVL